MSKIVKRANFKSTTRTVNLLGRDNVLDYRSAILELVKNSYDAFSKRVDINIKGDTIVVENKSGDKITTTEDKKATELEVIDYGNGMSLEKILDVFFTLGTDDKTNIVSVKHSNTERVMNGSMGIGRLSLGRLGSESQIITSNGKTAHSFVINWDNFKSGKPLETVKIDIEELTLEEFVLEYKKRNLKNNEKKGTILISRQLNDEWFLSDKNLAGTNYSLLKLTLNKLKNPLKLTESDDFQIVLNYFDEQELIEPSISEVSTDALIEFSFSHESDLLIFDGYFDEINISQLPPDFVNSKFEKLKNHIQDDNGENRKRYYFSDSYKISEFIPDKVPENPIGGFDGMLYFTKKTGTTKYPFINNPVFKTNEFEIEPGILLYRDGFRIRPYGEIDTIGFDWIGIENERAKNPAGAARAGYIMQANQLSGYINITKEANGGFEDQANREGLKNSEEFTFLRKIILQIIKNFSFVRSEIFILYNDFLKEQTDVNNHSEAGKKLKKKIDRLIAKHQGSREELFSDIEFINLLTPQSLLELYSLSDVSIEEKDNLINESDMLRTMATQGIVMSTFAHQIKNDRNFFEGIPNTLITMGDYYSKEFSYDFRSFIEDYNLYDYASIVTDKNSSILGFIDSSVNNPTRDKKKKLI
ncbi:Histidine Kinase [Streptococcus sp. DD11]|uniref:ATP-binding protein n=1 Tax=Streptococcus sp. DD11 TaxID=1777879 RepID=UPI00079B24CD|nr:ATP-binding protein [Streptococcus sp. DD11]KXT83899.1 Histidine Kinase [Streptococcus sp. DD11]